MAAVREAVMEQGRILLVEDEPLVARQLHDIFSYRAPTDVVTTAQDAILALEEPRNWALFLIDLDLWNATAGKATENRAGLAVALHARWRWPDTPAVVYTGHCVPDLRAEAEARGIEWLDKPVPKRVMDALAERARSATRDLDGRMSRAEDLAHAVFRGAIRKELEQAQMTPTQTRVFIVYAELTWQMQGKPPRSELAKALGMQEATLKKHISEILKLRNLGTNDLADVMPRLFSAVAVKLARMYAAHRDPARPPHDGPGSSGTRKRVDPDAQVMLDATEEEAAE